MATFDPPPRLRSYARPNSRPNPRPPGAPLRTDDLLVDAAFILAHDLPLTPESRSTLAGALRSRGYQLSPPT